MKTSSGANTVDGSWITNSETNYSLNLNMTWLNKYISTANVQYYLESLKQDKDKIFSNLSAEYYGEINANAKITCS